MLLSNSFFFLHKFDYVQYIMLDERLEYANIIKSQIGGRYDNVIYAHVSLMNQPLVGLLLPSSFFLLPSSFFLLPSSFFLLPSSFFLLPSSFFLLVLIFLIVLLRLSEEAPITSLMCTLLTTWLNMLSILIV